MENWKTETLIRHLEQINKKLGVVVGKELMKVLNHNEKVWCELQRRWDLGK